MLWHQSEKYTNGRGIIKNIQMNYLVLLCFYLFLSYFVFFKNFKIFLLSLKYFIIPDIFLIHQTNAIDKLKFSEKMGQYILFNLLLIILTIITKVYFF